MGRLVTALRRPTVMRGRTLWVVLALAALAASVALHYVQSLTRSSLFVFTLTNINIILVVVLLFLLARNLIKLYVEQRLRILGAGFRAKLTTIFIAFALIPAVLLFLLASGYLTNRIDYWFGIQAAAPLEHSLEVAQAYYQSAQDRALHDAAAFSRQIMQEPGFPGLVVDDRREALGRLLDEQRRARGVLGVEIYSPTGHLLGRAMDRRLTDAGPLPPVTDLLREALGGRSAVTVQSTGPDGPGDLVRAASVIREPAGSGPGSHPRPRGVLIVDALIPAALVAKMQAVSTAFQDYEQLKALKQPIKTNYLVSFLMITLVILFSATWIGLYVGRTITTPIQRLSEGTQAVARGNLDVRITTKAHDEVGLLVESFNKMTEDLQRASLELQRRRHYIETVLEHVATGVIAMDREGTITAFNNAAARIFRRRPDTILGRRASTVFADLRLSDLEKRLDRMRVENQRMHELELQCEVAKSPVTLRCALSTLSDETGQDLGAVIVFDDLTELLRAQKVAAWEEVARRIAHEIKNPLTPIQLSAERLKKKYQARDPDLDRTFAEATDVIINEVTSLKGLVDEFSRFARMPAPQPTLQDLNEVVGEIVGLYRNAHKDLEVIPTLAEGLPPVRLDRDQIKRALTNLFQNAIDAMHGKGRLWVTTIHDPGQGRVRIEVADEGDGVRPEDRDKLFLPYFSRKRAGSGLGLAIVHRIVTDHNGHIRVAGREPKGTAIVIELPA